MRFLFALPGLHRIGRGAEVVFEAVAQKIAERGEHEVTLVGSGEARLDRAYDFIHVPAVSRDHFEIWPKVPFFRSEFMYEDLTFAWRLARVAAVGNADVTMTCSYPYTSWALRRPRFGKRPLHVFVTQNGDWPAYERSAEARLFSCEGLICTNPIYYERNRARWNSTLIPNGVDPSRFRPGPERKAELGLPIDRPVILMVSALDPEKRVLEAIRAVAGVPNAYMVVAGDGPQRDQVDQLAAELLPGRFARRSFRHEQMPDVYRSADIFLHTKIRESFGNVYIEALSCGTPVVAHDDEVTRWILGNHARLVDTTSGAALTEAISAEIRSPGKSDVGATWARERYSWDVVAGKYMDFLVNVFERTAVSGVPQRPASGRRIGVKSEL